MFGSKLKTWMETHIVRPRRKSGQDKDKERRPKNTKGRFLVSSESLAHSDTGISSGSQQIHSCSTTDNNDSCCMATIGSEKGSTGVPHCHTVVNLSSPESAYSTGYSTDGASPGGTGPPEYYINIRTGKHYFPSPAPTPTSPLPSTPFTQLQTSFLSNPPLVPPKPALIPPAPLPRIPNLSSSVPNHFDIFNFSKSPSKKVPPKSPLSSLRLFLKSPKQDKVKIKPDGNKKKQGSPTKTNRKWYKQPFEKFGHRRTDSSEENTLKTKPKEVQVEKTQYCIPKETAASPRQRNRIRTNPWLCTQPMSAQNFRDLQINLSPSLVRNRSCTNTPLQTRKSTDLETFQDKIKQMNVKYEHSKNYLSDLEKVVNRHIGQKLFLDLSDHSEEDLTLNEMMGTYNESYVYEKETDILSDSDPTDCEDYVTDSEANNGGDERDSHDDELDFIDNGSIIENDDGKFKNTGRCTYHDNYIKKNSFLYRGSRNAKDEPETRKSFRREQKRKSKEEKKRKSIRKSMKSLESKEESKLKIESKEEIDERKYELNENVGGLNLSRVLMQRMIAKNGSKSAEGTPVCVRRRKLMRELRETHIGEEKTDLSKETESNTVVKAMLEKEIFYVDIEADKKYNELILEAENMLVSMQNTPVIDRRKLSNPKLDLLIADEVSFYDTKQNMDSVNIWRTTETLCSPKQLRNTNIPTRRSPKNLGLKLSVENAPKKVKHFEFSKDKKSFRAKSSAHSPLDPLGPMFKNFTVFKEIKPIKQISSSSSDDSEPIKLKPFEFNFEEGLAMPSSPVVPIAFQSVDLGKTLSYCPQSEPVKRKIYSCSKTYDQLVKRLENGQNPQAQRPARGLQRSATVKSNLNPKVNVPKLFPQETAKFFYNPVYSPYASPSSPNRTLYTAPKANNSPYFARTLSYEVEEFR